MFDWTWIAVSGTQLLMVFLTGVGIYLALLLLTRFTGLRSFSKMSSFDFAITVAFGSVIASTLLSKSPSLATGAFGLAVLFAIQYVVSKTRRLSGLAEHIFDNEPLLIMAGERVISDHLDKARMTEGDLKSKLRQAGITHPNQVMAVVFETTGDVSVLRRNEHIDPWIFSDVRGVDELSLAPVSS